MTQIVDQLADIILMEAVYGGGINAVDDEARDSEAYLHAQNAANRILTELATKNTNWGTIWDDTGRGLPEDATPYHPAEDRSIAYWDADEYWAKPVYQNTYTLCDAVTPAPQVMVPRDTTPEEKLSYVTVAPLRDS